MKKTISALFSLVIVLAFLLTTTGTASAFGGTPASLPDPVVTPISGDMEFTTQVIPIVSLPGTTEFGQMLVPVGFPEGEAQYGGNGVLVSGMDYGKANVCFYLPTAAVNQGWGGKVGVWNGTKWVLLSTTITPLDESPNSLVCASITGDGTYAFIKYITEPEKLPAGKPLCNVTLLGFFQRAAAGGGIWYFDMLGVFPDNPNKLITYTIIDPGKQITGTLTASVLSDDSGYFIFTDYSWLVPDNYTFTIHLETDSCYVEYVRVHYVED